ncbi:MAG: hypothetical protein LBF97_00515, partial [Elusimicrobiota bacterium]|nr:hypothetical protein [Elusimicrobiota bacterium]
NNIYFSNGSRLTNNALADNRVAKIRILRDGTFILQNNKDGTIGITDGTKEDTYSGGIEANNVLRIDSQYQDPYNASTTVDRNKLITVYGSMYPNANANVGTSTNTIAVDYNKTVNGNDIGKSISEHRFRNAFIRNIYGEIIQLDINHYEEQTTGPRVSLDLNNSNINNINSLYIKNNVNNTNVSTKANINTINWHNSGTTVDTLVSGDGTLSFISRRPLSGLLSDSNVSSKIVSTDNNTKRLVKIDANGSLYVKKDIVAYGNLTIGKSSQNTESDTVGGSNVNTTTIFGNFIVYPTKQDTNDYFKINANNGLMELRNYGSDDYISSIIVGVASDGISLKTTKTPTIYSSLDLKYSGFELRSGKTINNTPQICIKSEDVGNDNHNLSIKSYTGSNDDRYVAFNDTSVILCSRKSSTVSSYISLINDGTISINCSNGLSLGKDITITNSLTVKGTTTLTLDATLLSKLSVASSTTLQGQVKITYAESDSSTATKAASAAALIVGSTSGSGSIYAHGKVYSAVWNDIVDFIEIDEDTIVEYGKVYVLNNNTYRICKKRGEKGIIGISSDTYGLSTGSREGIKQMPIAVAGFVLAYVNKIYESGTELIACKNGILKKANIVERLFNRAAIVGTFYKPEKQEKWNNIEVDGRHWVKVK